MSTDFLVLRSFQFDFTTVFLFFGVHSLNYSSVLYTAQSNDNSIESILLRDHTHQHNHQHCHKSTGITNYQLEKSLKGQIRKNSNCELI